ncbi:MAG: flagellar motor stator protein MotA [Lactobacillus sp.]|jgi:chemotaxis protein MotA|nr:flagellar motor stator protein MotA [Lactobacillus sp.]
MDISTILGVVLGVGAVGVGMALKGADPHSLINPAAFLIIIAGTFAALFNAFPMRDLKIFFKLFGILFKGKKFMAKQEILELFVNASAAAKKEGVMAIERIANESKEPFVKTALILVADGFSADFIAEVIESDIKQMEERHRSGALIFAQCGMYAPTLGVLGAVIGLIAALGNLSDIDMLGHSIAAAFVATLLGIFCGYVCWHPFANKMKQLSKAEVEMKKMILEGALALQAGESSIAMEAKLQTFIEPSKRKSLREE